MQALTKKKHLPPADIEGEDEHKQNYVLTALKNIRQDYFLKTKKKEDIYFLAAAMLATAKSAGVKNSIMSWIHNGRYNAQERRLMGPMLEQFPISWDFEKDLTAAEFFSGLEEKINTSFKYRRSLGSVYKSGFQDECMTFMFQKSIYVLPIDNLPNELIDVPKNEWFAAENTLDVEVHLDTDGIYYLYLDYDASRYSDAAMQNFAKTFDEIVLQL